MVSTSLLFLTSVVLPSLTSAIALPYFTITKVHASAPYNKIDPDTQASIEINIRDPATGTSATCIHSWPAMATLRGPPDWMQCSDPTFAFRFNSFTNYTKWTIGIRHQYKGNGKPCLRTSGSGCVTRLGYGSFDWSVPGYDYWNINDLPLSSEGSAVRSSNSAWTYSSYKAPVYQSCAGCANNKPGSY